MDALTGTGMCGSNTPTSGEQAKCGVGPRQPLLVISPYSKQNFVDGTFTSQSSVVRFIEDNWLGSERISSNSNDNCAGTLNNMFDFAHPHGGQYQLDPSTGEKK